MPSRPGRVLYDAGRRQWPGLAPQIRVVSVSPGWVEGEYAQRMPPALIQEQRDKTPLARIASAEDVADAVLALATQLRFTTGTVIAVDGGRPLL